jgi:hypothetical protein
MHCFGVPGNDSTRSGFSTPQQLMEFLFWYALRAPQQLRHAVNLNDPESPME